jgi:hypothetical protein
VEEPLPKQAQGPEFKTTMLPRKCVCIVYMYIYAFALSSPRISHQDGIRVGKDLLGKMESFIYFSF